MAEWPHGPEMALPAGDVAPQNTVFRDAARLPSGAAYESMRWNAEHFGGGWPRMWDEGVGEVIRRRVAWFADVRAELAAALCG